MDLNVDMGESYGRYKLGNDEEVMKYITSANVACGFHASDFNHMRRTVQLAKRHGVKVGAHPSLPDRQGFGRREMKISREELANCVIYQVGALQGFLAAEGVKLNHIKPHGSLYGMAARMEDMAQAICDVADVFQVPIFGMINTFHETIYLARGHKLVSEVYADLDYNEAGGIIIAREHLAEDPETVAAKCLRAVRDGLVQTVAGNDAQVRADSICIHSDTPNAVELAKAVGAVIAPYLDAA
jgi:UPF0271 protein